jgi:predicted kinase
MAKLIIIRGNSGSGKTSVAKELQRRLGHNTMLISQDVIRRDMLKVRDGQGTKALGLLMELLQYGRKNSEVVILEGILNAAWYKELFRLAIELFKADIYAYYYDLPFSETLRRHNTKPNCGDFGEDEMRRWWMENDLIQIIPEKILTVELSVDKTVELIYQNILGDADLRQ